MESFFKGGGYLKFVPEYNKEQSPHAMDAVENYSNKAALVCNNSAVSITVPPPLPPPTSTNTSNNPPLSAPMYEVSLTIKNIEEAWEEWDLGLCNGPNGARTPSLRYLESTFKKTWRNTDAMRKRFSRRMHLINRIQVASQRLNISPVKVAKLMDNWKCQKGWRLDRVQKELELRARLEKKGNSLASLWGENDKLLFEHEKHKL